MTAMKTLLIQSFLTYEYRGRSFRDEYLNILYNIQLRSR